MTQRWIKNRTQGLSGRLFVLLAALLIALPAAAAIIGSEQDAGTKSGSRLRNNDRILIWPKAITSENGPRDPSPTNFSAQCVSLYNRSGVQYFVPWRTDSEWQAFLAARANGTLNTPTGTVDAGKCCAQQVVDVCGVSIPAADGVPPEKDTNLGQRPLSARSTPADPKDLLNYGAALDVKSMKSSFILNDNTINYEVTYMCDPDGTWTKTKEIGSCLPIDGACNAAYTTTPLTSMPPEAQWPNVLCGPGSILHDPSGTGAGPFVTGTGPWDWQCDGTPGRAPALCHADYNGCNTSIIPQKGFRKLPDDHASLCLSGNTTINLAPLVGNGPWDWQCQKDDNGFVSTCHANFDPSLDGVCNPAETGKSQSVIPLLKTGLCLGTDGITPSDAMADATCNNIRCTWTCAGSNGGKNTLCRAYRQQTPGQCGPLASSTPITKPADGDPGLCTQGTPTTVSGTPNGSTWNWGCTGSPNPNITQCSAPNSNAAINGQCGSAYGQLFTSDTPPDLSGTQYCAAGTAMPVVKTDLGNGAQTWTWYCQGINGGNDSGQCFSQYYPGYNGAACGSANHGTFATQPPAGALCGTGNTASGMTTTSNPDGWSWFCDDTKYPGAPVACSARNTVQPIPGQCGSANGGVFGDYAAPPNAAQLCNNGGTPISFVWPADGNNVATVTWGCAGQNGGADTSATACSGTFVPALDGQCGIATTWTPNNISIIQNAPAYQLCQPTGKSLPSNYAAHYDSDTPANSTISWTCSRASPTGKDAQCAAKYVPTPLNGQCGTIPSDQIASRPSDSILCLVGTSYDWSAPAPGSGPGTVKWKCTGLYGGQPATCQQVGVEVVDPKGQCGKANGAYVPDKPNYNLCAVGGGNASTVTGDGPWQWTCGTAHVQCEAYPCTVCAGNVDNAFTNVLVGNETTKTIGTCTMAGQPVWSANAQLQLSNDVPVVLSWVDGFNGAVVQNYTPSAAPKQYCAPCYMRPSNLINGDTGAMVRKVSGTCAPEITETKSIMPGIGLTP